MRFSEAILEKYAGVPTPSFLVAAFPDEESKKKLLEYQKSIDYIDASEILPPYEFHCTIRYVKKKDFDKQKEAIKAFKEIEDKLNFKINAKVKDVENLGPKKAFVLLLESEGMEKAFKILDKAIRDVGCPKSDYLSFTAHTTLFYDVEAKGQKKPDFELNYDRISFQDNEENVLWEIKL